ncbi:unnamed protein product [Eruca vesicaria subsp. sativa]|uniref:Peptidase C1A papain C-terminal domain-containing protein n=1 Tax=Eruca vesicaria subsp. sativa TaxID=29727 RepID=A0ABC8L8B2_ERUVS|nr:unnamed protein product [Eruca vesicaria subsp. sativa]
MSLENLSHEEIKNKYLGLKTNIERLNDERSYQSFAYIDVDVEAFPKSVDWRKKGAKCTMSRTKGSCRSYWACSPAATVEGINKIMKRNLKTLSEQELIDYESVTQFTTMAATVVS